MRRNNKVAAFRRRIATQEKQIELALIDPELPVFLRGRLHPALPVEGATRAPVIEKSNAEGSEG